MTGTAVHAPDRDAARVPVRGLTVLYDAGCSLCRNLSRRLSTRRQLVPLTLVPAGSEQARALFPGLDHGSTLEEITVVGDSGQVWTGARAWIVVLWALAEHRPLAHKLNTPAGARLARGAVFAAARLRDTAGPSAPAAGPGWGGGVYRATDGWRYDPARGWSRPDAGRPGFTAAPHPGACNDGTCGTG